MKLEVQPSPVAISQQAESSLSPPPPEFVCPITGKVILDKELKIRPYSMKIYAEKEKFYSRTS